MQNLSYRFVQAFFVMVALVGCATSQHEYQGAFNKENALTNNQKTFAQPSDAVFKITKQTFIQQGFTVENADIKSGIIKAVRNLQDKDEPEISYSIHTSADISELGPETSVSLSASQQTIMHRQTTTWWHLLWIIPVIPTGTEYQTLVIKEGNITDAGFYTDFFNSLTASVTKYDLSVKAAAAKAEAERVAAEKVAAAKAEEKRIEMAKAAAIKAEADRIAAAKAKAEADAKAAIEAKAAADKALADKEAAAKEAGRIADEAEKAEAAARKAKKTRKKVQKTS